MSPRAFVVAGLGFGDEGKGSVVDWLVRRHGASLVVRYNGGPQAAHHVVTDAGQWHCASQLGAGALVPGVRTHLAETVLVDPLALHGEARALLRLGVGDPLERLTIDPRAVVVTPLHGILNRMQELARGARRHGSCGRGVGQAQLDRERGGVPVVRVADLFTLDPLEGAITALWRVKLDLAEQLVDARPADEGLRGELVRLADKALPASMAAALHAVARRGAIRTAMRPPIDGPIVFEGAQGLLLDRDYGFFPHVTPSRTTFAGALACLEAIAGGAMPRSAAVRVGVLRAYATRHGAGPLLTEDSTLDAVPEPHNAAHPWQGAFRRGWFDVPAARHALRAVGGIDALVLTHLDTHEAHIAAAAGGHARAAIAYAEGALRRRVRDFPAGDGSIAAAAARTAWWSTCAPVYTEVPRDRDAFAAWLERDAALGVPIAARSEGPTARDKIVCARAPGSALL
jgi:adenylosuccinate synthase